MSKKASLQTSDYICADKIEVLIETDHFIYNIFRYLLFLFSGCHELEIIIISKV
jgi:hypothetical protein